MNEVFQTVIMGLRDFLKEYFHSFWDYETPKVMVVKNRTLGVIYRAVQFLVITYFIWYVFISQKAYQESETRPDSSIYTRMKGTVAHGDDILDTVEYARPSEGGDVISAILRREFTFDQRQSTCAEYFNVVNANCTTDSDCVTGEVNFDGHGRRTGRCVQYYNHTFKTCEIQTWCPVEEYAAVREPPLVEAVNFTVFIRNSIHFPKFKVLRGNIKEAPFKIRKRYLNKCHYHEEKEPYCPNFRLGYIANKARENFTELCRTGGVIGVFINWDCNLDRDPSHCKPTYSFRRLDLRKDDDNSGYYYRFAKYYSKGGVESRTLIKAYGIRLDIIVHGQAGKFSPIPTIISTVTAMTSVGICTVICDWIMLTFIDKNEVYSERKFDEEVCMWQLLRLTDTLHSDYTRRLSGCFAGQGSSRGRDQAEEKYRARLSQLWLEISQQQMSGYQGTYRSRSHRTLLHQQLWLNPFRLVRRRTTLIPSELAQSSITTCMNSLPPNDSGSLNNSE